MTFQQLPGRPSLEHLRKRAKSLLRGARAAKADALQRFQILPAFAGKTPAQLAALALALHDAQSVIAREHGFASWNALREHVQERSLSFADAVDEFVRCATGGAAGRARRLLTLHAGIARASLHTALVLGDAERVEAELREQPGLATQPGGPQSWEPLLYVCHTCLHDGPATGAALVAIARRLLTAGANPNAVYTWRWHPELPRTALWGALCTVRHLPLAEALLQAGARPTDGVSQHITAGTGDLAALELLHRHGADPDGIRGAVPPLAYILGFAKNPAGPRWLLEHGADPDLAWADSGEAPVHVAARRWDLAMVELLAHHGANVLARRTDGSSPYRLAALHGNHAVARWLLAHGAEDDLAPLERLIAACARGDRAEAEAMLQSSPGLRTELRQEHHLMLQRPAEAGHADALAAMLACGFDPAAKDRDGVTALHRAAMAGQPEAVRVLLAGGAPVDALDGMFAATPLVWAVEGWSNERTTKADHPAVARLLVDAGSPVEWHPPVGAPGPERVLEALTELRRAAGL